MIAIAISKANDTKVTKKIIIMGALLLPLLSTERPVFSELEGEL